MSQTLFHGTFTPRVDFDWAFVFGFDGLGIFNQSFCSIGAAIQQHILDSVAQFGLNFIVDFQHLWVDDTHIEARLDGVVQEHCVHGLANGIVATE